MKWCASLYYGCRQATYLAEELLKIRGAYWKWVLISNSCLGVGVYLKVGLFPFAIYSEKFVKLLHQLCFGEKWQTLRFCLCTAYTAGQVIGNILPCPPIEGLGNQCSLTSGQNLCFCLSFFICMQFLGQGVILDRSLFSDHVFASVSFSDGYISKEGKV